MSCISFRYRKSIDNERERKKEHPTKLKVKWNQRFTSKKNEKDNMNERYLTKSEKENWKISPMMILIKEFPKMNVPFYDSFEIKDRLYRILPKFTFHAILPSI